MGTYNMPGNCGNRRGGTGPVAIDTYPPTRLVSVVCDLHPWFLCKNSAPPSLRSQSDRVYISAPWNFIYLFLIWSRRHAESLPQLTGSASSVTWSSSHVREEDTRAKASQMKLSFIDHGSKQWQDAAEKKEKKRQRWAQGVVVFYTALCEIQLLKQTQSEWWGLGPVSGSKRPLMRFLPCWRAAVLYKHII